MTKLTKFNLFRYKELLKKVKSSTKTGKDYFQDPEVLELLSYQSSVEAQIFYDQKNEYLDLIQKYLCERISANQFRIEFIEMITDNIKKAGKIFQNFEELSVFWIKLGSGEFSSLLTEIHDLCLTVVEFGVGEEGISEDLFRNLIQKIFRKMKNL